jgi:hypothetical protein
MMVAALLAGGCRDGALVGPDAAVPPRHAEGEAALFFSSSFGYAEESITGVPWTYLGPLTPHQWYSITGTASYTRDRTPGFEDWESLDPVGWFGSSSRVRVSLGEPLGAIGMPMCVGMDPCTEDPALTTVGALYYGTEPRELWGARGGVGSYCDGVSGG